MMSKTSTTCVQIYHSTATELASTKRHLESHGVEDIADGTDLRTGPSFEGSNFVADGVFAVQQPERALYSSRRLHASPLLASE